MESLRKNGAIKPRTSTTRIGTYERSIHHLLPRNFRIDQAWELPRTTQQFNGKLSLKGILSALH